MNLPRLALAALAATIVDMAYGLVVYGNIIKSQFAHFPAVFRGDDSSMACLPYLVLGVFIEMIAATWIFAKGYEGGNGLSEGARCGLLLGVFVVGMSLINYAIFNIDRHLTASMAVAGLIEWTIDGAVIGLIYKPAAKT